MGGDIYNILDMSHILTGNNARFLCEPSKSSNIGCAGCCWSFPYIYIIEQLFYVTWANKEHSSDRCFKIFTCLNTTGTMMYAAWHI